MESLFNSLWRKITIVLGFTGVVVVNYLAVTGKINTVTTGAISDANPTLFTPKAYTFSIWGIIYLLLAFYILYQLFSKNLSMNGSQTKIALWFDLSCLANIGWIFAWHYNQLVISTLVMAVLLYCLCRIMLLIMGIERTFSSVISLEFPFGLYGGWITVATVANISTTLVHLQWDGFGIPPFIWLMIVLLIATIIAVIATGYTSNIAYPAAIIWGFTGILTRYLPDFAFDTQLETMWIVITLVVCLLILIIRWIDIISRRLA